MVEKGLRQSHMAVVASEFSKSSVFAVHTGCLPFTWRNRLVDGLCKWKAKFPYWKFPFGVACTI